MKKMKQLILLTLCVFTLFGMTACAGKDKTDNAADQTTCLLYTSPSPRDRG